jgi:MerR HTH family regulatory protein
VNLTVRHPHTLAGMTPQGKVWKTGELARETGLTVRTLHHYDQLGLLSPLSRTEGGHRCYTPDDVRRLHRIVALRSLGIPWRRSGCSLMASPTRSTCFDVSSTCWMSASARPSRCEREYSTCSQAVP